MFEKSGNWYGRWRVNGRYVKRMLGPVRTPAEKDGLTKAMAEKQLRRVMEAEDAVPVLAQRVTVEQAGRRLIRSLEDAGRKVSTIQAYESYLRIHIAPYFGEKPIERVTHLDIEQWMSHCRRKGGQSVKSTMNYFGLVHQTFKYAHRQGWVSKNPCDRVQRLSKPDEDPTIRFLSMEEVEALLNATLDTPLQQVDRLIYLTAVMTGMRQGEIIALRWQDVDWASRRIRVRRTYGRGGFTAPKSKRSSRAIPLADRLGGELDRFFKATPFNSDEDLVFCHPQTGGPMERSRLLKRYKAALKRAKVRPVRFHDLRHTFGTHMAARGIPMRMLQEWMGHRDFATTLIYADYQPSESEADFVNAAFALSEAASPEGSGEAV